MHFNIKRFWYDLVHYEDWRIINYFRDLNWKIKDYDRLEHDYSVVICYATGNNMSKTNYATGVVCSVIDDHYNETTMSFIKEDVKEIVKDGGSLEDVLEYLEIEK